MSRATPSLPRQWRRWAWLVLGWVGGVLAAGAAPRPFEVPAGPAAEALLLFSQQASVEVLFPYDELHAVTSAPVRGTLEPEAALSALLRGSGFVARRSFLGKYVVARLAPRTGSIRGRLALPSGAPAAQVKIAVADSPLGANADRDGQFSFGALPPGVYRLVANGPGLRPLEIVGVKVQAGRETELQPQTLLAADEFTRLAPHVVEGSSYRHGGDRDENGYNPQRAVGNLDLTRTMDDVLPFRIYDREQIARSGVVNLNEFLQREVLDGNAAARPPEQNGSLSSYVSGGNHLNLRGYTADETIILVNGRRLPEVLSNITIREGEPQSPDVNLIPLSLVQRVEVLPLSASALYSGNPVGGVINILLRPDVDATEVNYTYTNSLGDYDAPQSTASLVHGQALRDGRLRIRFGASFTSTTPVTEAELGYIQRNNSPNPSLASPLYRATPNVRSASGTPLLAGSSATVTSVAPGADGSGGLAAFAGRAGVRNLALFDGPGGMANSAESVDFTYGRGQRGSTYFGSVSYDVTPWLQLGVDGIYSASVFNRGYDVFPGDLTLRADSPFNPFGQEVRVSLNETVPQLGQNYSEARLEFSSVVLGALLKLPADWRVSVDAQYGYNHTKYRGLADFNRERWQRLVDEGRYNPLRDTQRYGPPAAFYDRVLEYYGARGRYVTLGRYETLDTAVRVTNAALPLPAGASVLSLGGDYRINRLARYVDVRRFGDGSLVGEPTVWAGRTLERFSVFGELQTPLLPARWLPRGLKAVEVDLAARYAVADTSSETNVAPTAGLKFDLAGGWALRGTVTTSNRFPSPLMSRQLVSGGGETGGGEVTLQTVIDPKRGGEEYPVRSSDAPNANLRPEAAVTRTAGVIWQRGDEHRWRASVDFTDTRKSGELEYLETNDVLNLEEIFPARVTRDAPEAGDPFAVGRIVSIRTGRINLAWRHSQNWTTAVDYAWTDCAGGRLDLYGRWLYFQRYDRQVLPTTPIVDELGNPSTSDHGLMRHRANFGASWSRADWGAGVDGHYFHSRRLPVTEWAAQHRRQINPYWQFDAFVKSELQHWLPWTQPKFGLSVQLRVNNVFNYAPPRYASEPSGAGVQAYGDWRRRTYALTLNATF